MKKPGDDQRLSDKELAEFEQRAADLQARLAASGLNYSFEACMALGLMEEAQRVMRESARILEEIRKGIFQ